MSGFEGDGDKGQGRAHALTADSGRMEEEEGTPPVLQSTGVVQGGSWSSRPRRAGVRATQPTRWRHNGGGSREGARAPPEATRWLEKRGDQQLCAGIARPPACAVKSDQLGLGPKDCRLCFVACAPCLAGLVCGVLMWLWGSREMWVRQ